MPPLNELRAFMAERLHGAPGLRLRTIRRRFSLGADVGQRATNIRIIAANVIIAETYYLREKCYRDTGVVPRGSRMGKPKDRACPNDKASNTVVVGHALDRPYTDRAAREAAIDN